MTKKQLGRLMVYVFIDLMIGKGQIVQEDHNGTKTDLRAKIKGTDTTVNGKRLQYLAALYSKLILLLRVLPVLAEEV